MNTWLNRGASGGPCGELNEEDQNPSRTDSHQPASAKPAVVQSFFVTLECELDRVPSRGVTPQPGQAGMHAVLSAVQLTGERVQYR